MNKDNDKHNQWSPMPEAPQEVGTVGNWIVCTLCKRTAASKLFCSFSSGIPDPGFRIFPFFETPKIQIVF